MFTSPFSSKKQILTPDSELVFVADMFASEYAGGAELTSQALIDSCPLKIDMVHSRDVNIELYEKLKKRSFLVFTGITRESSKSQDKSDLNPDKENLTNLISEIAEDFANNYSKENDIWSFLKECVKESWKLKKQFALNNNKSDILELSEKCLSTGAEFIKLLGAGDGGFIYCSVPENKQEKFKKMLSLIHI